MSRLSCEANMCRLIEPTPQCPVCLMPATRTGDGGEGLSCRPFVPPALFATHCSKPYITLGCVHLCVYKLM